jgi:hypothetical protein
MKFMKSAHQSSLGTPTCEELAPFQRKASSSGLVSPDFDAAWAAGLVSLLRISFATLLVVILPRLEVESTVLPHDRPQIVARHGGDEKRGAVAPLDRFNLANRFHPLGGG